MNNKFKKFKDALHEVDKSGSFYEVRKDCEETIDTIRQALTICQRLMEEPSEGMWEEGYIASGEKVTGNDCMAIFRAMVEQTMKEIEND